MTTGSVDSSEVGFPSSVGASVTGTACTDVSCTGAGTVGAASANAEFTAWDCGGTEIGTTTGADCSIGSWISSLIEGPDFTVVAGGMKLCVEGVGVFGLAGSGTTFPGFLALP